MKRLSLVLVALAALSSGCEKKTPPAPVAAPKADEAGLAHAATPVESDTILIGHVGSLTGAQATFGISTDQGIKLAIDEENGKGGVKGKKLVLKTYDDQGKPEEAANATIRLITQDGAKVILGEVASSNSLAMAPKAQEAKVPMISPSSTNPEVTKKGDYIFRVCFIDPFQGYAMAKFARENLKLTKVAILKDQKSDYSLGLTDVFERKFTELGGKIVATEAYSQGDTDFRAQLTSLKGKKPDGIYIPGYYTDVGIIAKQARELGLKGVLLGGDGWDSPKLTELGQSAVEGSYFTNHYSVEDPSPRVQNFIADYRKRFGDAPPDALGALGYDSAKVAIEAMRRAPDLSGPAIRDAIAATKDFPGVAGTITIDAERNAMKPAVVVQVTDGKQKYVATVTP